MTKQQYLSNCHDNFVNKVNQLLGMVACLEVLPEVTESDKRELDQIKILLKGNDVQDIERDLSNGIVRRSTLEKNEKLDKDLSDIAIDHLDGSPFWKLFLKELTRVQTDYLPFE